MPAHLDKTAGTMRPGLLLSLLLHGMVAAFLLVRFHPQQVKQAPPLAVELWAGGGAAQRPAAPVPQPEPRPEPTPAPAPAPQPVQQPAPPAPVLPDAQVKLKAPEPKPEVKPAPAKPEPQKKPEAKPEPAPPKPEPKKPEPAKPARPRPNVNAADDLLADLGPAGPGKDKVTQKGAKNGSPNGAPDGGGVDRDAYGDKVRAKVRPYVIVPPGLSGNPEAVVRVTLLPTLEVRQVELVKSSGNPAYDQAVQNAVWQARTFPPLPKGASFAEFRSFTLNFRPNS